MYSGQLDGFGLAPRELAHAVAARDDHRGHHLVHVDVRPAVLRADLPGLGHGRVLPWGGVLRSPHDRRIFALAVPALGALAAEPLYVLVDTAIVGHLGTTQLAALAIAATVLTTAFTVFNFLTYGTTAHVARLHGAGREKEAALVGSQALWLGVFIGWPSSSR